MFVSTRFGRNERERTRAIDNEIPGCMAFDPNIKRKKLKAVTTVSTTHILSPVLATPSPTYKAAHDTLATKASNNLNHPSHLEDAEGDGLVDGHGRADAHPDGVEGADEEHGGGYRSSEGVLELVDGFQEGHGDQADWHGGHGEHAEELVGNDAQGVEGGEEVPFWENLQGGGERIRGLAELRRFHHRQTHAARDRSENHDGEDVQKVVGPSGFAVVVVAHALCELGPEDGVGEVGLLRHAGDHLQVAASLGGGHAMEREGRVRYVSSLLRSFAQRLSECANIGKS